jgi:hypothetical protein
MNSYKADRSDLQVFAILETYTWICDNPWEKYEIWPEAADA